MAGNRCLAEQLAGDLLPQATIRQRIATGFHRNHRANSEGGICVHHQLISLKIFVRGNISIVMCPVRNEGNFQEPEKCHRVVDPLLRGIW